MLTIQSYKKKHPLSNKLDEGVSSKNYFFINLNDHQPLP